jgi:ketosteroid isomerase-like protein
MHRLTGLLLFLLVAPVQAGGDAVPDEAFFIRLVNEQYAAPFRAGDIDTWLGAFAEPAIALHNRRPMDRGKASIAAFGRAVKDYFELRQFDVRVTDVRRSTDWVYTAGEYTTHFVNKSDGMAPWGVEEGKFLLLWERQPDNSWKIILDTGNANQP